MADRTPVRAADLRGLNRLVIDSTAGVTDVVEAMQHNIARVPGAGLVYRSIRGITRLVGGGIDAALAPFTPLGEGSSSTGREAVLAALNGVLGDHLVETGNPLAIPMRFRHGGEPSGRRLLVLAHGLCMNDLQWNRKGHDHGAALARDLGFTPVYLHYNSGLHVSTNGRAFAGLIEELVEQWPVMAKEPVEELVILGHSMGGLITRSACHYGRAAGHSWLGHLKKAVFLGTPHHGSALERGGNRLDSILGFSRYTAPLGRLGKVRSAGITDLRHGNLLDADWEGQDRFDSPEDLREPVPLPDGVECYAMAGTASEAGDLRSRLLGDGLVPVDSALGRHEEADRTLSFPESRQWIAPGMKHFDLLNRPEAYEKIREWLAA
ncbi:MAG TPA: alpha/beta hydrolase [Thermoanaerobaculia bacterium]|nr:alpha/beta hydrolase [Thermoanaerobaculia bacterium]